MFVLSVKYRVDLYHLALSSEWKYAQEMSSKQYFFTLNGISDSAFVLLQLKFAYHGAFFVCAIQEVEEHCDSLQQWGNTTSGHSENVLLTNYRFFHPNMWTQVYKMLRKYLFTYSYINFLHLSYEIKLHRLKLKSVTLYSWYLPPLVGWAEGYWSRLFLMEKKWSQGYWPCM